MAVSREAVAQRVGKTIEELTVEDIMRERGVGRRQAAYDVRQLRAKTIDTSAVPRNQKAHIITALYALGGKAKNVPQLQAKMKEQGFFLETHGLVHAIWACQKDGSVGFQERKGGRTRTAQPGESALVRLYLTAKGRSQAMEILRAEADGVPAERPASTITVNGGRGAHAVGKDGTDYRQHGTKAVGGPIERRVAEPLPQNMKAEISTDAEIEPVSAEVPAASAEVTGKAEAADTHTGYPTAEQVRREERGIQPLSSVLWDDYPLIQELMGKEERLAKYQAAAEMLDKDDQVADIVLALLDKIQVSPLEKEVIGLLKELGM